MNPADLLLTRRELLRRSGMGMAALSLAGLLEQPAEAATVATNPLAVKQPHFPGKAKRVVHIFANGGASHVDTFDPKPMLDKYHGKPLPTANLRTRSEERRVGKECRL